MTAVEFRETLAIMAAAVTLAGLIIVGCVFVWFRRSAEFVPFEHERRAR